MPVVVAIVAVGAGVAVAAPIVKDVVEEGIEVVGDVVEAVGDLVEDVAEVVVDTVKYVAENPEVALIAVAAPALLPSIGITGIAVQPVTAGLISASQGGDLEDIGKAALGSFVGQGVGIPVAKGLGEAIGAAGNTAQTALVNAAGGAVGSAAGAVVTGQDVGEAALMGAAGSAGASLARSGATGLGQQPQSLIGDVAADVGEAAGRTAAGGDFRQELAGAALGSLTREGQLAFEELRSRPETAATKQAIAAFFLSGEISIAIHVSLSISRSIVSSPQACHSLAPITLEIVCTQRFKTSVCTTSAGSLNTARILSG